MRNASEDVKTLRGLSPQAISGAGAVNGVVINRVGYESAELNLIVGAITGAPTNLNLTWKVQEGDLADGTDAADVVGSTVTVTAVTANSETKLGIRLVPVKKYVRVVVTPAFTGGTAPTVLVAASWVLGEAKIVPVV